MNITLYRNIRRTVYAIYYRMEYIAHAVFFMSIVLCLTSAFLFTSGCAYKKIARGEKVYKKIELKSDDVQEIVYIRRNVETQAYERLRLVSGSAELERSSKSFKPLKLDIDETEFLGLAQKAVSLSWEIKPVRIRNSSLEEELVLKTTGKEEKVLFHEDLSAGFKDLYNRLIAIRQKMLDKKRQKGN